MISNKTFRPIIFVLLSLLVNAFSVAQQVVSLDVDGVSYSVDLSQGTASLVKCNTLANTNVTIPDFVEYAAVKYPVVTICENAYYGTPITTLSIPATVTYIERDAFYGCASLSSVELKDGDSLLTFAPSSFSCFGLPSGVTSKFTTLKLGRNIYFTSANPFANQRELISIEIGPKVTSLPNFVFSNDIALKSVTIPANVREIGQLAFDCCTGLVEVLGLEENTLITEFSSYLFRGCNSLKRVSSPKNLSVIGDHAFTNCLSLEEFTISSSVDSVMYCAFDGCTSLKSLVITDGYNPLYFDNQSEGACFKLCPLEYIYFGRNVTKLYSSPLPFAEKPTLKKVTFSNTVTTIDNSLLYGSTSLTELSIPASVIKVGSFAFDGCTSLKSVTFEASATPITLNNSYTTGFEDAPLDNLYLYRPITLSNQYGSPFAFAQSTLKNVYLSDYAGNYQDGFFQENNSIQNVFLNTDVSIKPNAVLFNNLSGIENLYIGANVTRIPSQMFCNCTKLEHVYSEAVTPPALASDNFSKQSLIVKVPDYTVSAYRAVAEWNNAGKNLIYSDKDDVTRLTLSGNTHLRDFSNQLKGVGQLSLSGHFVDDDWKYLSGMSQLVSLDISATDVDSIPAHQFEKSSLRSFSMPSSVHFVGDYAFYGSDKLEASFNFSDYVHVGNYAFANCPLIHEVTFVGTNARNAKLCNFKDYAFAHSGVRSFVLPANLGTIGKAVWVGCDELAYFGMSAENSTYYVENGILCMHDKTVKQIPGGALKGSYSIPEGLVAIGDYACAEMANANTMRIPLSMTKFGPYAFADCPNLNRIILSRTEPVYIDYNVFNGDYNHTTLYLDVDKSIVDKAVRYYKTATLYEGDTQKTNYWSQFSEIIGTEKDPIHVDPDPEPESYQITVNVVGPGQFIVPYTTVEEKMDVYCTIKPEGDNVLKELYINNVRQSFSGTSFRFSMPSSDVVIKAVFGANAYDIAVSDCLGGKIKVADQAEPSSNVSVQFIPDDDYQLISWSVNGEPKSLEDSTFTMPYADVTVSAVFARIVRHLYVDQTIQNGMVLVNGKSVSEPVEVLRDDSITISAVPDSLYLFNDWCVMGSDSVFADSLISNPATFVMPAKDVYVSARFEKMTFSVAVDSTIVNGSVVAMPQIASPGDTVALTIQPEQDYMLTSWTAGEGVTQLGDSAFIMPFGDVIVTATFERVKHHVIVSDSIMNGSVEVMPSSVAVYGDTIVVKANPESELYYFTRWTIIDSNGVELALLPLEGDSTSFVMPTCDVHVSAQFEQYVFLITHVAENGSIYSEDSAVPTDTVPVTIVPAFDYELVNWSAGDDVTLVGDSAFVMPFHDVELTASFTRIRHHVVVSDSIENGMVIISPDASAFVYGDTIKLVAETSDLYDFAGWQIEGLSETVSDSSAISFVMPTNDVYVSASFVKKIFAIKAISSEGGMIVVDSMASPRDTVRIELIPMDDYRLVEWSAGDDVVLLGDSAFVMPFNEVTLSASFVRLEHQVKADAQGQGTIVEGYATEAVFGDTITIVAKPDDGYRFDGWVSDDLADLPADSILTFTMPANDVHVTAIFKVITYAIIKSDEMLGGTFEVMGGYDEAAAGDTIVLCAMADLGYDFDGWEIEGAEITYPLATTSFVMPAHPVTVKAIFKDATRISSLATDWSVVLAENEIRVEGLQGSETVMVTSAAGALVFEAIGNSGSVHISTIDIESGTYILRVNQSIYKLFIH